MTDPRITPQAKADAHIHYVVAFMGGILGLYPVFNVIHLFGSAQTSNLIEIILCITGSRWQDAVLHLLGAFLYALGVFIATWIPAHTKLNIKTISVFVDVIIAFVMWRLPADLPKTVYLYPTFFAMALQWSAFPGSYGFICSTIFSTNNLKQTVSALTEAYCNGKPEFKLKAAFFSATMLGFHLGVAVCALLWKCFGNAAFLFVIIPALIVLILLKKNQSSE